MNEAKVLWQLVPYLISSLENCNLEVSESISQPPFWIESLHLSISYFHLPPLVIMRIQGSRVFDQETYPLLWQNGRFREQIIAPCSRLFGV